MGKKTSYAINKIVKVSHRFVLITFRCVFLVYYIVMLVIVNIDVLFSHFVCVVFLSQDEEVPPAYCLRDKFLASNVINFASFRDKSRAQECRGCQNRFQKSLRRVISDTRVQDTHISHFVMMFSLLDDAMEEKKT